MTRDKKLYISSMLVLTLAFVGALVNDRIKSGVLFHIDNAVYCLFFVVFLAATYFYNKRAHEVSVVIEILCLEFFMASFYTMEFLFNRNPDRVIYVGAIAFFAMWCSFFLTILRHGREVISTIGDFLKTCFTKHILLVTILVIYAVMFTANYSVWFRGDSFTYFSSASLNLNAWDYTLNTIHTFMMGGHVTFSYSVVLDTFMLPLTFFGVRPEIAFRITNLVMSEATIAMFYAILCGLFKNLSAFARAMLTAAFSFAPLFWGISYLASSDFALLCFFALFIFASLYELKIMRPVAMIALCFTKETAIILSFGYFIGGLIHTMASAKEIKPISRFLRHLIKNTWFILSCIVFCSAMFIGQRGWIHDFHIILKSVLLGIPIPKFPDIIVPGHYQLFKLNSLFAAHFMWIAALLVLAYLIFALIKKPLRDLKKNAFLVSLLCSGALYYVFDLVYFNYVHYRYSQYNLLIMMILVGFALDEMVKSNVLRNVIPTVLACLFLTECYFTLDPVTRKTWNTFDSGNGEAVTMQMYFYQVKDAIGYVEGDRNSVVCTAFLNDGIDHNRSIIGLQRCLEEAMREISYTDSKAIVIDSYGDFLQLSLLGLFGYPEETSFNWNPELNTVQVKYHDVTGDLIGDEELPGYPVTFLESTYYGEVVNSSVERENDFDEVYYFDFTFNQNITDNYLDGRQIINTRIITDGIWQIRVLKLKNTGA